MSHDSVEWGWGRIWNLWARILQIRQNSVRWGTTTTRKASCGLQTELWKKSFLPLLQNHLHNEENSLLLAILTCSMGADHSNHIQACPFPKARSFNLGFLQIRIHRCGDHGKTIRGSSRTGGMENLIFESLKSVSLKYFGDHKPEEFPLKSKMLQYSSPKSFPLLLFYVN